MAVEQSLPTRIPTDEEIAQIEVGHTTIAPITIVFLLVCFLSAIASVPLIEWVSVGTTRDDSGPTPWSHLSNLYDELHAQFERASAANTGIWRLAISANHTAIAGLSQFERALEAESRTARALRPPIQIGLTRWLRAGNESVYPGREGWLFYRDDVEYLTRPGFLDRRQLASRIEAATESSTSIEADPRPAILQFKRDLEQRGIALIVVPTPVKPSVHPEMLVRAANHPRVLHNPSYSTFVADLRRAGVLVFDPSEALAEARHAAAQFLATDTHWRPEVMEAIAEDLAAFVSTHVGLPLAGEPAYRVERSEIQNVGDTARMLNLPPRVPLFPPERVWLRRVLLADGSPFRSSRDGDVLLLGDSFSNVYSLASMGWGTSAGFAEQLSYALARPLDRIVQNDNGAFAPREVLQKEPDRLRGKRGVIYQFAARELSFGDWKVLPLPTNGR